MAKVIVALSMSLDRFIAGSNDGNGPLPGLPVFVTAGTHLRFRVVKWRRRGSESGLPATPRRSLHAR